MVAEVKVVDRSAASERAVVADVGYRHSIARAWLSSLERCSPSEDDAVLRLPAICIAESRRGSAPWLVPSREWACVAERDSAAAGKLEPVGSIRGRPVDQSGRTDRIRTHLDRAVVCGGSGPSRGCESTTTGRMGPSNKGMKLTKLSAAWLPGWTCRLMPAPSRSDAGTASQLIPGVRPTRGGSPARRSHPGRGHGAPCVSPPDGAAAAPQRCVLACRLQLTDSRW
jgi:hypothetical protein